IPSTVIPIAIAAFAAYAFAWMRFPFRNVLFLLLVGLLAVPLQVTLIPVLSMFKTFHLNGTFLGIWLAHTGYGLPFAIYLLRNFFGALPSDLFESAAIDGAGPVTTFFRLVLPLSVPALASLAIFQFLWTWNDLLVALVYLGGDPEVAPMTVTVANSVMTSSSGRAITARTSNKKKFWVSDGVPGSAALAACGSGAIATAWAEPLGNGSPANGSVPISPALAGCATGARVGVAAA